MRDAAVSSSMVTGAHHWDIEDSSTGVAGAGVMPPPRLSFGGKTPYAAPELPGAVLCWWRNKWGEHSGPCCCWRDISRY